MLALLGITRVGEEIVSANNLYGDTYQLFHYTFPKLGRTVKFVESSQPEEFIPRPEGRGLPAPSFAILQVKEKCKFWGIRACQRQASPSAAHL